MMKKIKKIKKIKTKRQAFQACTDSDRDTILPIVSQCTIRMKLKL